MRLMWNEIRARASAFAKEWRDASREDVEAKTFYTELFRTMDIKPRNVARWFEHKVKLPENRHGYIDLFAPGMLLVEHKSAGRNLQKAAEQAMDYFDALKQEERPRYLLLSDFQTFEFRDLDTGETAFFPLKDLPRHIDKFGFLIGRQKVTFKDQDPVNIRAAERVGALHDALEASGFTGHDLERFLVRIVFCLFADDTGVFEPRDIFLEWLTHRTAEDGSDLGPKLAQLFQVLDTPEDKRSKKLDEELAAFPYVNGELFAGATTIPAFDKTMRQALINAATFDWSPISPAIFGSLFQSVMNEEERRKSGAHYTTEKNILKVIGPLFMDMLHGEFARAFELRRGRRQALEALHSKLAGLTFLDPACGCGNFLVIAYRELRLLEIEILKAIDADKDSGARHFEMDVAQLSRINVDQFYGIEIGDFAAEIAKTAMWMMDHIMNNRLSEAFGLTYARIPLEVSAHIRCADALSMDWGELIAPDKCSYIIGNPPFVGAKMQKERAAQVHSIARLGGSGGTLDYVAAWFIKAGEFVRRTDKNIEVGFVATNSITQGEQVAQLWPILFERHQLELNFAHRTFAWGSDARGRAHVHVVIVGMSKREFEAKEKRLFSYHNVDGEAEESGYRALSAYLIGLSDPDLRHIVVAEIGSPDDDRPRLKSGCQPIDDGNLILSEDEKSEFLNLEPRAREYLRPYMGGNDFISNEPRWILALQQAPPEDLKAMPHVLERLRRVTEFRRDSDREATKALADYPAKFNVEVLPDAPFLALPESSSERREYLPVGWLSPPLVPSNTLRFIEGAPVHWFALLCSAMHAGWMRTITGRLKSDYRYSVGVVYNNFPLPAPTEQLRTVLSPTGQAILDARRAFPTSNLAALYDPETMPPALRKAHHANDRAVDRLYRTKAFASERERVEHLLMLYEKLRAPVLAKAQQRKRKGRS